MIYSSTLFYSLLLILSTRWIRKSKHSLELYSEILLQKYSFGLIFYSHLWVDILVPTRSDKVSCHVQRDIYEKNQLSAIRISTTGFPRIMKHRLQGCIMVKYALISMTLPRGGGGSLLNFG